MRFIRKTSYAQDIDLFKHNGQRFWYGVLALAVAAAPGVAAGWRAAGAMNLAAGDMVRPGVHPGVVLGLAAVVALGGLHTLWRRG